MNLLRTEIVQVTGCTEPASVAYAFLTARRRLTKPFDPLTITATLAASLEVLRNASTAVVPFLNRRGLRTVVAVGLSSRAEGFNLFPKADRLMVRKLLHRRAWLCVHLARQKGVYVRAVLSTPTESVSVVIAGRHDEIRAIDRNGTNIFRSPPHRQQPVRIAEIMKAVAKRDRRLEDIARDFIVRQVRGNPSQPLPKRVAALI